MTNRLSNPPSVPLGERELGEALDATPVDGSHHRAFVRLDGGTVCLHSVHALDPAELWLWYSAAAARRAAVTGPGLMPLVASGQSEGRFYVAYDMGSAIPLAAYREIVELSTTQAISMLWGIAAALDHAVAQGLYPTEVTPESIFVDPIRGPLLADLGVARETLGNPPAARDRNAAWVAPEVLRGGKAQERSATYSFGALSYTLFAGAPPHEGSRRQIAEAEPPRLAKLRPDLPPALGLVIATAMARDARRRYHSADEARRLMTVVAGGSLEPETVEVEKPERRRAKRDRRRARRASPPDAPAAAPLEKSDPEAEVPAREAEQAEKHAREAEARRERDEEKRTLEAQQRKQRDQKRAREAERREREEAARRQREDAEQRRRAEAERAREAAAAAERAHPRRARRPVPAEKPERAGRATREKALVVVALGAALALGAVGGVLLAGGGESPSPPSPPERAASAGFSVALPDGWRQTRSGGAGLAAVPEGDRGSGLTVQALGEPVEAEERLEAVRLGELEAWRDPRADVPGARAAVRYVAPTSAGKLVITCRAGSRAPGGLLRLCERSASTLRLRSVTPVALASVLAEEERARVAAGRMSRQRAAARRKLARARRPAGQRLAAEALARVYERVARSLAELREGQAVAEAASAAAAAYRRLARAAVKQDKRSWNAARSGVRTSEAKLAEALAG